MRVYVVKALSNLLNYVTDFFVWKRVIVKSPHLHQPVKIHVKNFKQDVKAFFMSQNFVTNHNVLVLETDHRFNFCIPHSCLPTYKFPFKNLQRWYLIRLFVVNLINNSKRSLAQNLEYSESLNKDGANRMGQVCMVLGLRLILNVIVRSVH